MDVCQVAVRIRPMTQCESLKREMIIHCEVPFTQHNLVMCSDANRFIQLTADKVYSVEATQQEVREGYEGVVLGGNHLVMVVGGRGSGKSVTVFGKVEEGNVGELGIAAGILEKALERDIEFIRFSAILLRLNTFEDLLSSEANESPIKRSVGNTTEARFLIGKTHTARQKALETESEPDQTHTLLVIEIKASVEINKIVICVTEAQTSETQIAIQRYFSGQTGSKTQNYLTDFLKSELAGTAKVHILGSVSPVIDHASASLTTLHFLSSLKTAKPIKPQLPPRARSSKRSARTSSLGSSPLSEASLLQLVMLGDADISEAMETLRKMELSTAAEELSKSLPGQGRCPVCTLRLPCGHFREAGEAMRSAAPSQMSSIDSRLRTPRNDRSSSTQRHQQDSKERTFRYRDKSGAYVQTKSTPESQPLPQSKLALMEKLEAYREEKLRKELQHLEELKAQKQAENEAANQREIQRRKYYEQQKLKLAEYHAKKKQRVSRSLHVTLKPQKPKLPSSDRISLYNYKRDFIFHMVARQEKNWGLLRHTLMPTQRVQKDAVDLL